MYWCQIHRQCSLVNTNHPIFKKEQPASTMAFPAIGTSVDVCFGVLQEADHPLHNLCYQWGNSIVGGLFLSLLQNAEHLAAQSVTCCGQAAWTCSTAMSCSISRSMQHEHGHVLWAETCSTDMDMQHGHRNAAWAWACSIDMGMLYGHGHVAWIWAWCWVIIFAL